MARAVENGASLRAQLDHFFLPRARLLNVFLVMHYLQSNQLSEDCPAPDEDDPGEPD
jgi:hypothetical protein